ncbi:hypothetical protein ACF1BE_17050 [Streptomyces sp. NPDC014991]|nr:hypothetical protein [Streptomyces dangxiongensis]
MEDPPDGGGRDNRKTARRIFGWLALQALGAWLRHQLENIF